MHFKNVLFFIAIPTFVTTLGQSKFSQRLAKFKSLEAKVAGNWSDDESPRIFGSEIANIDDYPWMAQLWAIITDPILPVSNAIIVNKYYATTTIRAIHSIPDPSANFLLIVNFDPDHIQSQYILPVKEIIEHSDFHDTSQYDIALVRVCPGIPQKYFAPIASPNIRDVVNVGDPATMVSFSLGLTKATKSVAEWCECERYPDWNMDQHLCLECSSDVYADFASRDDFGMVPTVINGKVSAMVLAASQDCIHMYGDIAINLAKFSDWIQEKSVYDESM